MKDWEIFIIIPIAMSIAAFIGVKIGLWLGDKFLVDEKGETQ